jgi:hypothetical protein
MVKTKSGRKRKYHQVSKITSGWRIKKKLQKKGVKGFKFILNPKEKRKKPRHHKKRRKSYKLTIPLSRTKLPLNKRPFKKMRHQGVTIHTNVTKGKSRSKRRSQLLKRMGPKNRLWAAPVRSIGI